MATSTLFDYLYLRTDPEAPTLLHSLGADAGDYAVYTGYEVCGVNFDSELGGVTLGAVDVQTLLLTQARKNGVAYVDVMDRPHSDLAEMHDLVFEESGAFLSDFLELMGCDVQAADICYVPEDDLLDKQWGPHVLHALMQHHGHCGFFAVRVEALAKAQEGLSAKDRAAGASRAEKLLAMGYSQCPDTPYFFFNMAYAVPPLPQPLRLQTLLDVATTADREPVSV